MATLMENDNQASRSVTVPIVLCLIIMAAILVIAVMAVYFIARKAKHSSSFSTDPTPQMIPNASYHSRGAWTQNTAGEGSCEYELIYLESRLT